MKNEEVTDALALSERDNLVSGDAMRSRPPTDDEVPVPDAEMIRSDNTDEMVFRGFANALMRHQREEGSRR